MANVNPDLKKDAIVREMHDKNQLSFRQIAKLMDNSVKTVWLRYKRSVGKHGKLSTVKRLRS